MKPAAIVCGTAMLICYAILGTIYQVNWFIVPVGFFGVVTLVMGLGEEKVKQ
jgi:hypothetical protein